VQTDVIIPKTKPRIIIRDDEIGTRTSVDAAVSAERNVITKEAEIILKYTDLTTEISACRM
jgi:hypothetical protein